MKQLGYSKFGRMGRLGNQLFQLASLQGMAKRYNRELQIPIDWKYKYYFSKPVAKQGEKLPFDNDINESHYHHDWEQWDKHLQNNDNELVSVSGWLQSYKYFPSRKDILELFEFLPDYKNACKEHFKHLFEKPTIAITIRAGQDYKDNGNYVILPINYYIGALYEYFPDWEEHYNILVFADDMEYAKLNLDCHPNIFFAEGLSDIDQLCVASMCQHHILANSTFSWWCAYLSTNNGTVIRPPKYFQGYLAETSDEKDFWPPHWEVFEYMEDQYPNDPKRWSNRMKKFPLKDVTFTIPVQFDHEDRAQNLAISLNWINENFDTNIIVGENGGPVLNSLCLTNGYMMFQLEEFYRTKILNYMAKEASTPIIINFDCDNICPILQILLAVRLLRNKKADGVYPYDGRVARLNREKWLPTLQKSLDCGNLKGEVFRGTRPQDPKSVGHIVMWNKEKFLEGGGENENFISYGPEDVERWERFVKLGYNIQRVKGIVYHIDHYTGPDSSGANPHFGKNYEELERIRKMSGNELKEEIKSWK